MLRLIEKGLMYGNLIEVSSPALIARYNRALEKLAGRTTALPDFHVDVSGFSPEIADELDDPFYLNPNGANRQFILLTTEQKTAPLLDPMFSMHRRILRDFIEANEVQLFALTAKDAVMGELENSVFDLSDPARLLDIRRITVHADTTEAHVANASELEYKIRTFREEPDAWWDDVLIAEMIELAKQTGDVTRNPIVLERPTFEAPDYWTAHHGGLYLFQSVDAAFVVMAGKPVDLPTRTIHISDHTRVARYLHENGLAEPILQNKSGRGAAILRQKMDFILVDVAAQLDIDIPVRDRRQLRRLEPQLAHALPPEYRSLAALVRWAEGKGRWPRIDSEDPAFFYTLRARPGPAQELVNQLLSELSPLDARQLFICHKPLFYRLYRSWPEKKKSFVADFLEAEYLIDKAGARAALFGADEPEMAEPRPEVERSMVERVGPWGAVRRR